MALDPKKNIRPWIPQVGPNDQNNYDPYEYKAYPRMMTKLCTQADLDDWLANNSYTADNGKTAYKGNRPVVGTAIPYLDAARRPIIVNDADEEAAFLAAHPPAAGVARIELPAQNSDAIAAKEKEIAELKAQLAAATTEKRKPGRPSKALAGNAVDLPANLSAV